MSKHETHMIVWLSLMFLIFCGLIAWCDYQQTIACYEHAEQVTDCHR